MIIELGHYALVLALATSLIISVLPVIGARRGDAAMMASISVFENFMRPPERNTDHADGHVQVFRISCA